MRLPPYFRCADVDVGQPHTRARPRCVEAAAVVFDLEPQPGIFSVALLIEPEMDIFGSGVTGDVAKGLLRDAKDGFLGTGKQSVIVRKVSEFGSDASAGPVLQ